MSRQIGSLHRSNSHPANLRIPIPLFAFPPPDSPQINSLSGMNSDTNSDTRVFQTLSQFNNSDIEIPDEFTDSEPFPLPIAKPTLQSSQDPPPFDLFNLNTTIIKSTNTYTNFRLYFIVISIIHINRNIH